MVNGKIVIAGGSGFLGKTLGKWFTDQEREVVVLSRRPDSGEYGRATMWDGMSLGAWTDELEGASALINLAGRSVDCRYTARNRKAIMDSRILSTRVLGEAVGNCSSPPAVWLNSSTATIYKHTYGDPHGEDGTIGAAPEAKDGFSIEVATAWEEEFEKAQTPETRKVVLRCAMVFGNEPGGVYEILTRLTRLGLGGKMAEGQQYVSWIHAEDFCRAIEWLIDKPNAEGIYNISAPNPLRNAEMMKILRRTLGMPVGLPAYRWMLEIGTFFMRTETELVIKSRRVIPERLLGEDFSFLFPSLELAVENLEKGTASR